MDNHIKIVLVDDEILFRKGVFFLLDREKNIQIIAEASNGVELVTFLNENENHPDIVIMDLKMPLLNGVEATKILHKEYPQIKIIALTSYDSSSFIANMINVGAVSYLVKNSTPQELLQLICEQKTTAEIGEKLFISPRTVEGHRNNLLLKTESKNSAGLVVYAIQNEI